MSRSKYIYVLQCIEDGRILAVRTVKRDLVGYLKQCGLSRSVLENACQFIRFPDARGTPFFYDWKDIPS
jgi:hypothetical protein